jgi:hypothetical protein
MVDGRGRTRGQLNSWSEQPYKAEDQAMIRKRPLTALAHATLAVSLALAVTACGGDDDDAADTTEAPTATDAPTATEAPGTTAAMAEADPAAFCAAELEIEKAVNSEGDPSGAIAAASAVAPADVKPTFDTVVAEFEASGGESEAFATAYGELITWMKDNCGFNLIEATTQEYAFAGIPEEVPAGPTIITNTNLGEEFHEVLLMRKNDGVTESFDEIIALPEDEGMSKATVMAVAFGPPGAESYAVGDLTPGEYLAICFLPKGATPEVMAQMEGPESSLPPGAGPPHFTEGMLFEFTVT